MILSFVFTILSYFSTINTDLTSFELSLKENRFYYCVSEEVDLDGRTIDLPESAIIDFRGGMKKNGTLKCHNSIFQGKEGLANSVVLSGNVIGPFDISVFELRRDDKDFDIGAILNHVNAVCKSIVVPEGKFYIQTPVQLTDIRRYQQYGDLIYNGKSKDVTAVQFLNASSAVINIDGKIAYDIATDIIDYTKASRTNIIGVEFININNSSVFVNDVEYFNNNIRISAYGAGNCYNKYSFNLSVFSNEHVRIFQKNQPSNQIGWCNENIFLGGRFCNWSHFDWKKCESVAIRVEGPEEGDSYNGANSLLFIKPCMEGFEDCAVYAKNVTGCHWQDARTEGSKKFVKFVGDCRNNLINSMYGTERIDYSECFTYPLRLGNMFPVYITKDSQKKSLEIDTKEAKVFKVVFSNSETKARVGIQYLTNHTGENVSKTVQQQMMRPRSAGHPHSFYFNSDSGLWMLAVDSFETDFVIPNEVTKIRLYLMGQFEGATIYSDRTTNIIEK